DDHLKKMLRNMLSAFSRPSTVPVRTHARVQIKHTISSHISCFSTCARFPRSVVQYPLSSPIRVYTASFPSSLPPPHSLRACLSQRLEWGKGNMHCVNEWAEETYQKFGEEGVEDEKDTKDGCFLQIRQDLFYFLYFFLFFFFFFFFF
uniref:Uncharacterized protein n=1 Tax=Serinus canaria TaxID=9135 RepID=A0A8C9NPV5_SERCA